MCNRTSKAFVGIEWSPTSAALCRAEFENQTKSTAPLIICWPGSIMSQLCSLTNWYGHWHCCLTRPKFWPIFLLIPIQTLLSEVKFFDTNTETLTEFVHKGSHARSSPKQMILAACSKKKNEKWKSGAVMKYSISVRWPLNTTKAFHWVSTKHFVISRPLSWASLHNVLWSFNSMLVKSRLTTLSLPCSAQFDLTKIRQQMTPDIISPNSESMSEEGNT